MPTRGPFTGLRFPPEGERQEQPVVSQARVERAIFHGPFLKQMPMQAAKISRNCCLAARRSVKRAKGGGTAGLGPTTLRFFPPGKLRSGGIICWWNKKATGLPSRALLRWAGSHGLQGASRPLSELPTPFLLDDKCCGETDVDVSRLIFVR